ncbi:phospholipid scramblase 2 [Ixodes scapularis]
MTANRQKTCLQFQHAAAQPLQRSNLPSGARPHHSQSGNSCLERVPDCRNPTRVLAATQRPSSSAGTTRHRRCSLFTSRVRRHSVRAASVSDLSSLVPQASMSYSPYQPGTAPGYPPPSQGYPAPGFGAEQGYPPPTQGYPPPSQGYPPPAQGYPPPAQGYPPPGMGYPTPQGDMAYGGPPITQPPSASQGGYPAPEMGYGAAPPAAPNCPPGLEYLTAIDQLLVKQKVELLEAFLGFETQNKYTIKNSMGQKVYHATEDTDCCTRNCCGPARPFDIKVADNSGNEVLHFQRDLRCTSCCCPCCLQSPKETPVRRSDDGGGVPKQTNFCGGGDGGVEKRVEVASYGTMLSVRLRHDFAAAAMQGGGAQASHVTSGGSYGANYKFV